MWIPIRRDRTSKPPLGTPLRSDGHWSVQGLVAIPLNEGGGHTVFDSLGNRGSVVTTGKGKITQNGWENDGEFGNRVDFGPSVCNFTANCTFIIGVKRASASEGMLLSKGTYAINDGYYIQFVASGKVQFVTGRQSVESVEAPPIETPCTISVRKAGTQGAIFISGKKSALSVDNALGIVDTGRSFMVGDYPSPGFCLDGIIYWLLPYSISLSDTQIASISANPWQIYEPETVWIEVGGAFSFAGVCASSQPLQISYASGELRFDGNLVQAQPTQVAALSSVLAFVASAGQSQAAQSEIAAALLSFQGRIYQSQGEQMQAASDLVAKINAILRATSSDPLALTISVRDPLALRVTVH